MLLDAWAGLSFDDLFVGGFGVGVHADGAIGIYMVGNWVSKCGEIIPKEVLEGFEVWEGERVPQSQGG